MSTTELNKHFRIVLHTKDETRRDRKLIGAGQLARYIGESNAFKCISKAIQSKLDKTELNFRKEGKVIFYVK